MGKTLEASDYRWNHSTRDAVIAVGDVTVAYDSPVSSGLFTSFTEVQLWSLIGGIAALLVLLNLWAAHLPRLQSFHLAIGHRKATGTVPEGLR